MLLCVVLRCWRVQEGSNSSGKKVVAQVATEEYYSPVAERSVGRATSMLWWF